MSLTVVAVAAALAAAPEPELDTAPDWLRRPNMDEIAEYYPVTANRLHLPGYAVIACRTTKAGGLGDCRPVYESPEGLGFGASAVRMSVVMRMKLGTIKGEPVESAVRVPIRFSIPETTPTEPLSGATDDSRAMARVLIGGLGGGEALFQTMIDAMVEPVAGDAAVSPQTRAAAAQALRQAAAPLKAPAGAALVEGYAAWFRADQLREAIEFLRGGGRSAPPSLTPSAMEQAHEQALDPFMNRLVADAQKRFCATFDCALRTAPPEAR